MGKSQKMTLVVGMVGLGSEREDDKRILAIPTVLKKEELLLHGKVKLHAKLEKGLILPNEEREINGMYRFLKDSLFF